MADRTLRIVLLADRPDLIPALTDWFMAEWGPYYGAGGPGDAAADLRGCLNRDTLPVALVALDADDTLLGTVALKEESVGSALGVGPWLAAFLVAPQHRGRGVGAALVAAIEGEAARLGFAEIYTSTDTAEGILERRGWLPFGATQSLRGPLKIYRFSTGG